MTSLPRSGGGQRAGGVVGGNIVLRLEFVFDVMLSARTASSVHISYGSATDGEPTKQKKTQEKHRPPSK